jgi:hypothetical protein
MSSRVVPLALVATVLIGATAGVLVRMKRSHELGAPGVKIVNLPLVSDSGTIARTNSVFLPSLVNGWASKIEPVSELELSYLPKDTTYGRRTYHSAADSFAAWASVVLMGTDRTSIHRPEYCLTGVGWAIERRTDTRIRMSRPQPYELPVRRFDATRHAMVDGQARMQKGVYVFWFVADNQLTASHWDRQWRIARDLLLKGTLDRWAYVAYFAQCNPGEEDSTFERLSQLITATVPEFQLPAGAAVN